MRRPATDINTKQRRILEFIRDSLHNEYRCPTVREICKIENVTERQQRDQGLNLSGGHTNAVEFTCSLLGYPTMQQLLVEFEKTLSGDFCNAS